ncbi:MAG TPA: GntR family transcriptional regulator [Ktedonobacteraceae bacterium]|nr:GntR family transcriptional regulator [Ktedonobacteraceae bacterium]
MLWIAIDRSRDTSLIRQVYDQVRLRITRGDLQAGEQLPSTRQLAADLHVSRIVILEAYGQLLAEGYIESREGSGTYVAEGTYLEAVQREQPPPVHTVADTGRKNNSIIDFRSGLPALDLFPRKLWGHLAQQACAESSTAYPIDAVCKNLGMLYRGR